MKLVKKVIGIFFVIAMAACNNSDDKEDIVYGNVSSLLNIYIVDNNGENLLSADSDECCLTKDQFVENGSYYRFKRMVSGKETFVTATFSEDKGCLQLVEVLPEVNSNGALVIEIKNGEDVRLERTYIHENYKKGWRYKLLVNDSEVECNAREPEKGNPKYYPSEHNYTVVLN